ncbi:MAG: hypothetical protein LBQ52_03065 [Helicobacteraceae bacterium]|jgi:hypothetical protein|nr:hypothetical protein [Helicobacteraceae bacterium]
MFISSYATAFASQNDLYALDRAEALADRQKTAQKQNEAPIETRLDAKLAYESAAIGIDGFIVADIGSRLLDASADTQGYIDRALILRAQSSQALAKDNIKEAIQTQNMVLASRGEPPITPAEEQRLIARIYAIAKQKIALLDSFALKLRGESIEIRS